MKRRFIQSDLCTSCGVCVGVCPVSCIHMIETSDGFRPLIDESRCLPKCDLCSKVCPPLNNWYTKNQISEYRKNTYGSLCGQHINLYTGWSNDFGIRRSGTPGGLATHIVKFLFENEEIDSVILVRSKKDSPLGLESYLGLNVRDIYQGAKSKYQLVSFDKSLQEARTKKVKKLAIVGLPCHIQAIHRAEEYDSFLKNRVAIKIGIFCGYNATRDFLRFFIEKENLHEKDIVRVKYREGNWYNSDYVIFETRDKIFKFSFRTSYLNAIWKGHLFLQKACAFCPDVVGESADISLGDAWLPEFSANEEGVSLCLTKSEKGEGIINKMLRYKELILIKRSIEDLFTAQFSQFLFKKQKRFYRQEMAKFLSIPFFQVDTSFQVTDFYPRKSVSGIKGFLKTIIRSRLLLNIEALYYFITTRLFTIFQRLGIARYIPMQLLKLHSRILRIIY